MPAARCSGAGARHARSAIGSRVRRAERRERQRQPVQQRAGAAGAVHGRDQIERLPIRADQQVLAVVER